MPSGTVRLNTGSSDSGSSFMDCKCCSAKASVVRSENYTGKKQEVDDENGKQ